MLNQFIVHEIQGTSDTPVTFPVPDGTDPEIIKEDALARFHSIMTAAYSGDVEYAGAYMVYMTEATPGKISTYIVADEIRKKREVTA